MIADSFVASQSMFHSRDFTKSKNGMKQSSEAIPKNFEGTVAPTHSIIGMTGHFWVPE